MLFLTHVLHLNLWYLCCYMLLDALIRGKKHLQEPVAQPERLEEYLLEWHCRTEPTSDPFLAAARFELERTGDLPQAQEFLERCLVMHYGGHGNANNLDAAAALFQLKRSCRQAGDLLQAQGLLKECLQMQRGLHGNTHHFDIAAALFELGCSCRHAGDLPQAQRSSWRSACRCSAAFTTTLSIFEIASALFELGRSCRQAGDLPQAQKFLEERLQMQCDLYISRKLALAS